VHCGSVVLVDAHGTIHWSVGDPHLVTFPRSSLKPFQALALVARGGVERFGLDQRDLAIACASHTAQAIHVDAVCSLLSKIGARPEALACGAHAPIDSVTASELARRGEAPSAVHNNCSGKHSGMLALARLLDAPLEDYLDLTHAAQQAIFLTLVDVLELDIGHLPVGVDGCSAPAYAVPLDKMARGFALLGDPSQAPVRWREPLSILGSAMRAHPELIAATSGRVDTDLMRGSAGAIVAKGGAEGYFGMGHQSGLGVAVKILDGDSTSRARGVAAVATAERLGWVTPGALAAHGPRKPMLNWAGRPTGEVRPAPALLDG
jgi:L-asparaginase II